MKYIINPPMPSELKRSFYEDDVLVLTKPGYNAEISASLKQKESSHGNVSFVDGMGIRSTPYLESHLNRLRVALYDKLSLYAAEIGTQITAVSSETKSIANSVHDTIKEPLLPSTIYILTATLASSIFASKKSWPIRFAAPLTVGVASTAYFMPRTYGTLKSKYNATEKEYFPRLHQQKQDQIVSTYNFFKDELILLSSQTQKAVFRGVHDTRMTLQLLLDTN